MADGEQELTGPQGPLALSMIICDRVHIDQGTGKAFLLGCFGSIGAETFPAKHPSMTVFAEVTGCRGRTPFVVRLIDVDERHAPLAEATTEVEMLEPLEIGMLVLPLEDMVFPEPGEYRVQLFSGDTPLMERRCLLIPPPGETNG
jgi:hypothetical protein